MRRRTKEELAQAQAAEDELEAMLLEKTVRQLKEYAQQRSFDVKGLNEKQELIDLILGRESKPAPAPAGKAPVPPSL